MSGPAWLAGIGALVTAIIVFATGISVLALIDTPTACPPPSGMHVLLSSPGPVAQITEEQLTQAQTIVSTGADLGVSEYGWVIAIAVALQESGLRVLDHGDQAGPDSRGLFQQRSGWGPAAERLDPAASARLFYTGGHHGQPGLLDIPGWQNLPLTQAAQAVQHSAYPTAYAAHEDTATAIVTTTIRAADGSGSVNDRDDCPRPCPTAANHSGASPPVTCTRGETILTRAATWLTAWNTGPVPYLASTDPKTWFRGYRRDCSGYVSMALGLPGPGLTTAGLAAHATPITKSELRPGDLLINPAPHLAGHIVIFDHWTDPTMTDYVGYEQSGDGGTHHRTIPYPYFDHYPMRPYTTHD